MCISPYFLSVGTKTGNVFLTFLQDIQLGKSFLHHVLEHLSEWWKGRLHFKTNMFLLAQLCGCAGQMVLGKICIYAYAFCTESCQLLIQSNLFTAAATAYDNSTSAEVTILHTESWPNFSWKCLISHKPLYQERFLVSPTTTTERATQS